jgi:hypothetical protein
MTKVFRVDIPSNFGGDDWTFVNEFDTRDEAIEFCMSEYGSDNQGRINLISEDDSEADLDLLVNVPMTDIADNTEEVTEIRHVTRLATDRDDSSNC